MKKEFNRTELKHVIYSALLDKDVQKFVKLPKNFADDYMNDLCWELAEEYTHRLFDLELANIA